MKKLPVVITILIFALFFHQDVKAIEVTKKEELSLDTSIIREDENFILAKQIVVAPIFANTNEVRLNDTKRFRTLYYYTVQKLGFTDMPFHYVISKSGEVFEGNSGGDERRVAVNNIGGSVILIGYLADNLTNSFDPRAEKALADLLLEVANRNAIKPENISAHGLKFIRNEENNSVLLEGSDIFGNWNITLQRIVNEIKPSYSPARKDYQFRVEKFEVPAGEVNPGDEVTAKITLKNTGGYTIYGGSENELILSKQAGGASRFFVNNVWASNAQILLMDDSKNIRPGEEESFDIKLKAPIAFGEVVESFELKTIGGEKINAESFNIALTMKKGDKRIIEIPGGRGFDYLNVRNEPSTVAKEFARVTPGQRFVVQDDAGNGFLKIQLDDGRTGWVAGWYTVDVN